MAMWTATGSRCYPFKEVTDVRHTRPLRAFVLRNRMRGKLGADVHERNGLDRNSRCHFSCPSRRGRGTA